jgi:hypothetical protein
VHRPPDRPAHAPVPGARVLRALLALAVLNAVLAFENVWPTPFVKPDSRLAPEFVLLWVALLAAVKAFGALTRTQVAALAGLYAALVVGRYVDVSVPALFGRAINVYWDGQLFLRFLSVARQHLALWEQAAIVLGLAGLLWLLYRTLRWAIAVVAHDAAPAALRSTAALAATAGALVLVAANTAGFEATWPVVSKPVTPTYLRQADLLITAASPQRLAAALPPSPAFDSDLAALGGADVKLVFLESYGAMVFEDTAARRRLAGAGAVLARAIEASGRGVVSAYVRSPTFGGASELAHLSLLSGIDLSDPLRHDLLLTTGRRTLVDVFRARGYETFGLYPALSWDWPERAFYRFDRFLDGRDLGYRGPHFGYWWIPDQFALARFEALHPVGADSPPRLLFFPTITSHAPFRPVPPYQPDWSRVLSGQPFDEADVRRALADEVDWTDLLPAYLRTIEYTYAWIGGHLAQPSPRDYLLILIGDHQPVRSVSGSGASWDVPVHVISSHPALLERFVARGFRPGLEPRLPALGGMHELTPILLEAFDGRRATDRSAGV